MLPKEHEVEFGLHQIYVLLHVQSSTATNQKTKFLKIIYVLVSSDYLKRCVNNLKKQKKFFGHDC